MFCPGEAPKQATKPWPWSVWVRYANSMLPVAAVFGGIGLLVVPVIVLTSHVEVGHRQSLMGQNGDASVDWVRPEF
jgi:hypothetical protein